MVEFNPKDLEIIRCGSLPNLDAANDLTCPGKVISLGFEFPCEGDCGVGLIGSRTVLAMLPVESDVSAAHTLSVYGRTFGTPARWNQHHSIRTSAT